MDRNIFYDELSDWLSTITTRPGNFGELPDNNPNLPYFVLYSVNSPVGEGSWRDPEDDRDLVVQVTCVGRSAKQANWMSDAAKKAMVGRDATGKYQYPMTNVEGGTVLWRTSDSLGSVDKSGDRLFQVVDTYRIRVAE